MTHNAANGDPPSSSTIIVGIVGTILLLAVVVFAVVLFLNTQYYEDQRKLYTGQPQELADMRFKQRAAISDSHFVDEAAGIIAIPVDDAIGLYADALKRGTLPTTLPAKKVEPPAATSQGATP